MACLKCGKETKDNQVFCQHCLDSMADYPVKSDIHISLPTHPSQPAPKKSWHKRRNLSDAEQMTHLRTSLRRMALLVLLLTLLLCVTGAMLVHTLMQQPDTTLGRNYTYQSSDE